MGTRTFVGIALVCAGCQGAAEPVHVGEGTPTRAEITNGENAATCQWPSTAALIRPGPDPFCSSTLIHPRFVLTAAHCITMGGMPSAIAFGEDAYNPERSIGVVGCELHPEYGTGVDVDLAVCELAEEVDDVQTVPVLMGCEQDVLQVGAEIMIAGFGNTQSQFLNGFYWSGEGIGPKRYVAQAIHEVRTEAEEVDFLGIDTMSGGCHGDSGGGAFVQLADGTWRVFAVAQSLWNVPGYDFSSTGTDESGVGGFIDPVTTTGEASTTASFIDPTSAGFIEPTSSGEPMDVCGYGTTYSLVTPRMDWVEQVIGEDVSACFTTDGTWDPNEACTPFPMQLEQSVGTWATGCAGKLGGDPQCGELPAGTSTSTGPAESSSGPGPAETETDAPMSTSDPSTSSSTTGDPPLPTWSGTSSDTSDTDEPAAEGGGDDGCGCRHDGGPPPALLVLVLLALRRRR